jgi:hypothetical protein
LIKRSVSCRTFKQAIERTRTPPSQPLLMQRTHLLSSSCNRPPAPAFAQKNCHSRDTCQNQCRPCEPLETKPESLLLFRLGPASTARRPEMPRLWAPAVTPLSLSDPLARLALPRSCNGVTPLVKTSMRKRLQEIPPTPLRRPQSQFCLINLTAWRSPRHSPFSPELVFMRVLSNPPGGKLLQ